MITKGKLSLMSPVHPSKQQTSESVRASLMKEPRPQGLEKPPGWEGGNENSKSKD